MSLRQTLLPDSPRDFPGRRLIRSILRTVHILGGGVLIGAYLFEQSASSIHTWYACAVISGLLLLLTDLHASCALVFEWRGLAIMSKIGLMLALPAVPGYEVYILGAILTIGSLSSHLSRQFRHRMWWTLPDVAQDTRHG